MSFDVAIVGAGLAGALSASLLARKGLAVALIDPHSIYPPDFRCEKMEGSHADVLRRTGLGPILFGLATHTDRLWYARFGRLLDVETFHQYGFRYEALVNAYRDAVPAQVTWHRGMVRTIETKGDSRRVLISDGTEIEARLVILANGLNRSLGRTLRIEQGVVSPCHSICIGFDLRATGAADFAFPALQYNAERKSNRVAYLTLFRIGTAMRANLFLYHNMDSPVIADFRERPQEALEALLPDLARVIGRYAIVGPVRIRPTDLESPRRSHFPGIVMVGDAYFIPCPVTGMGTLKAMTDVERLCEIYVPRWLAEGRELTPDRISEFYRDPVKVECDRRAFAKAHQLKRLSTGTGFRWSVERWARFANRYCRGLLRRRRIAPSDAAGGLLDVGDLPGEAPPSR